MVDFISKSILIVDDEAYIRLLIEQTLEELEDQFERAPAREAGLSEIVGNLDKLKARAKESLQKHGGLDPEAFPKLSSLLRYVDGDYKDPSTFQALRKQLKDAQRPAHYLAIPPALFGAVVDQLVQSGCAKGGRVIVEKPFGHLTAEKNLDRKIKNLVIGAMSGSVAQNKPIFKKEAKLIITAGDRSDMILVALEADAAGVILTNNVLPPSNIISMAKDRGTPLLLVNPDTYQVQRQIEQLEPLLTKDDPAAIELLTSLIREHVDLAAIGVI